jgi:hypothetical protein
MKKSLLLFLVFVVALGFMGCGGSKEKPVTTVLEEEPVEIIIAEAEEAEEVEEEEAEMSTEEMEDLQAKIEEHQRAEAERRAAEEAAAARAAEEAAAAAAAAEAAKAKALKDIRIKVLNGNGKHHSARAMRGKLEAFGYTVERIDNAPTSNFSKNVVFYAKGLDREAEALAKTVGGSIVTKPLTWFSIFDLIVVTGKRS